MIFALDFDLMGSFEKFVIRLNLDFIARVTKSLIEGCEAVDKVVSGINVIIVRHVFSLDGNYLIISGMIK